jgi:Tfp pilus assembly protein PilO
VTLPVVLIAGAYVWFVFLPGKARHRQLKQELEDKRAFILSGSNVLLTINGVEKKVAAAQEYVDHWRPESADSAAIAARFGRIAQTLQQAGVVTTRFAPEPPVRLERLQKLPLRLSCEGSFPQVCGMLDALERSGERLWIERLALEPLAEDGQIIKCDLCLAIFADNLKKTN